MGAPPKREPEPRAASPSRPAPHGFGNSRKRPRAPLPRPAFAASAERWTYRAAAVVLGAAALYAVSDGLLRLLRGEAGPIGDWEPLHLVTLSGLLLPAGLVLTLLPGEAPARVLPLVALAWMAALVPLVLLGESDAGSVAALGLALLALGAVAAAALALKLARQAEKEARRVLALAAATPAALALAALVVLAFLAWSELAFATASGEGARAAFAFSARMGAALSVMVPGLSAGFLAYAAIRARLAPADRAAFLGSLLVVSFPNDLISIDVASAGALVGRGLVLAGLAWGFGVAAQPERKVESGGAGPPGLAEPARDSR